jgi:glycosyltransferase involved in cell wall biosynthesis
LFKKIWQEECDAFAPGYKIPIPDCFFEKVRREIAEADLVLCPSRFVEESMIQNGVPASKCFTRHFGVDTSIFKPREKVPDVPVFICVGNICLRKGHHYLFRAWQKVKPHLPSNARLICVGLVLKDFQNEWFRWKGTFEYYRHFNHQALARLLSQCTAFVFPSLEEGFARVLSEAMACGLPLIATHESGASTIMRDQLEGILIPPRNVDAIADAMIRLAKDKDLNSQMGKAAYAAGARDNSWHDYALCLLQEFTRRVGRAG